MGFIDEENIESWSSALRQLVAWRKTEALGWVYVSVAVLLALGVSLRRELSQPVTALVTVYIFM